MNKIFFRLFIAALLTGLSNIAISGPLCVYFPSGHNPGADQAPDDKAFSQVSQAYEYLCPGGSCGTVEFLQNNSIQNAMAFWDGRTNPVIRYNYQFMASTYNRHGPNATYGIFAHELGHTINFRMGKNGNISQIEQEKIADQYAGCALAKAGLPSDSMDSSLRSMSSPSPSYPSAGERMYLVKNGYDRCR